jgi:DNA-binding XRE family transcriptional regulator
MIGNERQLRVSREQLVYLRQVRSGYEATPQADPIAQTALLSSVDTLIGDVEAEIAEYEALKAGQLDVVTVTELADFPTALIKARIAAGLTQRQLAERLGVAEQAVQRDEAGGYARATLDRVRRIADVLGLEVTGTFRFRHHGSKPDHSAHS